MVIINSFVNPESPLKLQLNSVEAVLDKTSLGKGDLFVNERTLSWKNNENTGFSIEYPNIVLHGISRDVNVHSKDGIFLLTEYFTLPSNNMNRQQELIRNGDNESDEDEESETTTELFLIPEDIISIPALYHAIKECQELNPDPTDQTDEEGDDDEMDENDIDHLMSRMNTNGLEDNPIENEDIEFEDAD